MANGILSKQALKKLLDQYKNKLESINLPIKTVYLYGSYSKKKPREWSDVDICVVSPAFHDSIEATMMLMKIRGDDELLISPIAFSPENFVDENPLAWEIKKTGIQL